MSTRDELAERFYREQDWHSCNGISLGPYITRTFKAGYDACAAERDNRVVSCERCPQEKEHCGMPVLNEAEQEREKHEGRHIPVYLSYDNYRLPKRAVWLRMQSGAADATAENTDGV